MAKDKKGFILYADQSELFNQLTNEKAGELIKHIYAYVNDEKPSTKDLLINLAFTPIKQQLKRDLEKFEQVKVKRSEAGKKSAESRANKRKQESTNPTSVDFVKHISTNPTVKENDNVNVIVNVKEKDINIDTALPFSFYNSLLKLGASKELVSEWIKVRKTKKATNSKTALDNFIKQQKKTNVSIDKVLELCVINSWSGFNSDWYKEPNKEPRTKQQIYEEQLNKLSEEHKNKNQ